MDTKIRDRKSILVDSGTHRRLNEVRGQLPLAAFLRNLSKFLVGDDDMEEFAIPGDVKEVLKKAGFPKKVTSQMLKMESEFDQMKARLEEIEKWILPGQTLMGYQQTGDEVKPIIYDSTGENKEAMAKSDADQQQRIQAILDERKRRGIQ